MKWIAALFSLCFISSIILMGISIPSYREMSNCTLIYSESLGENARQANIYRWSPEKVCKEETKIFLDYIQCYKKAEEQEKIPMPLIEKMAKVLGLEILTLQDQLKTHNQDCLKYPKYQLLY